MALKDIPEPWLFKTLRWTPKVWFGIVVILFMGLIVENFLLEQLVSFLPQGLIVSSGLFLIVFTLYARLIIRDGWRRCKTIVGAGDLAWIGAAIFFSLVVFFQSAAIATPTDFSQGAGFKLKIATYNKWVMSEDVSSISAHFLKDNLDLLVLQEANEDEAQSIAQVLGLTHSYSTDCGCSAEETDVHILSRHQLAGGEKIFEHATGAIARVTMRHPGIGDVSVYGLHIPPPYTPTGYDNRNQGFENLTAALKQDELPKVVLGDFNTTVYSPHWQQFQSDVSGEVQPLFNQEWPQCSWYGFGDAQCLRIDHILVSKNAAIQELLIGPETGSDHRSLSATLQMQ